MEKMIAALPVKTFSYKFMVWEKTDYVLSVKNGSVGRFFPFKSIVTNVMRNKGSTIFCLILIQFFYCGCFQCPGYDIPKKFRCDAINNCGDNSDEEDCPGGK